MVTRRAVRDAAFPHRTQVLAVRALGARVGEAVVALPSGELAEQLVVGDLSHPRFIRLGLRDECRIVVHAVMRQEVHDVLEPSFGNAVGAVLLDPLRHIHDAFVIELHVPDDFDDRVVGDDDCLSCAHGILQRSKMASERNPTDALDQALSEQRMGGAEKSVLDIIAKALDVPLEIVHRVIYAYNGLTNNYINHLPDIGITSPAKDWSDLIESYEVRLAIDKHMEAGARRYMVRWAIENKKTLEITPQALLPVSDRGNICNGCPVRMECVINSLYTPEQCYGVDGRGGRIHRLSVTPLRIHRGKVDVKAIQPMGEYTVSIGAFPLHRY